MNDNKMTRPVGDATGRAETGAETEQATTSTKNDITPAVERQQFWIANILLKGEERFVKGMKRRAAEIVKVAEAVEEADV